MGRRERVRAERVSGREGGEKENLIRMRFFLPCTRVNIHTCAHIYRYETDMRPISWVRFEKMHAREDTHMRKCIHTLPHTHTHIHREAFRALPPALGFKV